MESLKLKCDCLDWKENIKILNAPYTLGLAAVGSYTAKAFSYCPWCGSQLIIKSDDHSRLRADQCNCGMTAFKESSAGCPIHGANEFGII